MRRLGPGDAPAMTGLFRRAFPAERVQDTILAAPGAALWLARLMEPPELQGDHTHLGIDDGEGLAAFAELRAVGEAWHLNHIAVDPRAQGQGLARRLLEEGLALGAGRGLRRQSLDVDPANEKAAAWYARLGFVTTAVRGVHHAPLPPAWGEAERVVLEGWPTACACQEAYGFSQFTLRHGGVGYGIGRLAALRFRVTQMLPEPVRRALARLAPGAVLVTILGAGDGHWNTKPTYLVHRMERTV